MLRRSGLESWARRALAGGWRQHRDVSTGPAELGAEVPVAMSGEAPLVDSFGRRHNYLRISLTERCNLRCTYCMPADGAPLSPREALVTSRELLQLARQFTALGVDKVRLTGGEPTLRIDLPEIIAALKKDAGVRTVGLTTNGLVLTRRLASYRSAGLDALNVSLDSLQPRRYEELARRPGLARVLAGVELALQLGYSPVKINTVLMKGVNDDEICDFVELTRDRDVEVRFIEFMPFSGNAWDTSRLVPHREALRAIARRYPDLAPAAPRDNDTAQVWQVAGHVGRVGFISSMTQHFCATCNRLRLTADGQLKVCLFGSAEVSLLAALRGGADDASLRALIRNALLNKKKQHAARAARGARWSRGGRQRLGVRMYSTSSGGGGGGMSHVDGAGRARMVDVSRKPVSARSAAAACRLHVSGAAMAALRANSVRKGDALGVARVAGVLAAKRTSDLIPLCHALPLDVVRVHLELPDAPPPGQDEQGGAVTVRCEVAAQARTGAEMEALVGAALAALTLYDMCKALDKHMSVTDLRVTHKAGGATPWPAPSPRTLPDPPLRPAAPAAPDESYVPTNLAYY